MANAERNLTLDLLGIDTIIAKMDSPQLIAVPLRGYLNDLALLGQRVARQSAPRDTGNLARSIYVDVQPLYSRVYTDLGYAPVMEYGAPSAQINSGSTWMPPSDALLGWVQRHGFGVGVSQSIATRRFVRTGAQSVASAAFVLARAIKRRGIKGRFFFQKAKAAVEVAQPARLTVMAREVELLWGRR